LDREGALKAGLAALGLDLGQQLQVKLIQYLDLLGRWNSAYNLTAIRDPQAMVPWHLLDSLAISPYLRGPRVIDVGTGAGLPGIPLAIANPEISVSLLDSRRKRLQFLIQVAKVLDLDNVDMVHQRAEQYRPEQKFDTLVARAFGTLPKLLTAAGHLCRPGGSMLVLKGRDPQRELNQLPKGTVEIVDVKPLRVPLLDAARHLVILRPMSADEAETRVDSPTKDSITNHGENRRSRQSKRRCG
jgi:16S rRNA (guanine527-N7)-methyltransferase